MNQLLTAVVKKMVIYQTQQLVTEVLYVQLQFIYLVFNFTSYFFQILLFLFRQRQLGRYRVTFGNQRSLLFFREY